MDVRAGADLATLVASVRPATIFHLAAQTDVRKAVADPGLDAAVNVAGTINVLEAARAVGARVLFASTGGAGYGAYEGLPVPSPETAETRPLSPYGASKMSGEEYLRLYHRLHGVETVSLRLANVYGPRQDPHGEAGVVAIFCGLLLDGRPPRVFGDGNQTRDYVFIDDTVHAFVQATDRGSGKVVNVGTGLETSVNHVYRLLSEITGFAGEPEHGPPPPGELRRIALDISSAPTAIAWKPWTHLEDGLAETVAYLKGI
jgi:UDP-glucose 4-epimerase